MTTIAMVAGMLPIAIGWRAIRASARRWASRHRRADHVDVLSLFVVPVVYTYVDDAIGGIRRKLPRRHEAAPAVESPAER